MFVAGTVALVFGIALYARLAGRAHRPAGPRDPVLADPVSPAGADPGAGDRLDLPDGTERRLAQSSRCARRSASDGQGPINIFSHAGTDLLPGARLDAVRVPAAHRDLALHGPGAGGGERRVGRVAAHHVPPHHLAGAAAGPAGARDPDHADHRRAVRAAADHRPAGQISVFSYRIYFELNPLGSLPNYGAAAALSLPFIVFGALLLLLYNRVIRRAESFVTVTGKAYRQRRLAARGLAHPGARLRAASTSRSPPCCRLWCCSGRASSATCCR